MVRTAIVSSLASVVFALSAVAANATTAKNGANVTGQNANGGGHQVCLKHQCPGRSRIICGCARPNG